jgi:ketosteroid isomerase-like protein
MGPSRRLIGTLLGLWLLAGCARRAPLSAEDGRQVSEVLEAQRQAWNRGDLDGYMAGYARSEQLVFTSGGRIRRGWEATLAAYRKRYGGDRRGMGQLTFQVLDVQPAGAGAAVMLGRWRLTGTAQAGSGVFTLVFERRPEGWRIVHDHTSSDPP